MSCQALQMESRNGMSFHTHQRAVCQQEKQTAGQFRGTVCFKFQSKHKDGMLFNTPASSVWCRAGKTPIVWERTGEERQEDWIGGHLVPRDLKCSSPLKRRLSPCVVTPSGMGNPFTGVAHQIFTVHNSSKLQLRSSNQHNVMVGVTTA